MLQDGVRRVFASIELRSVSSSVLEAIPRQVC